MESRAANGIDNLPLELFESILQLTPASQHSNFSRVCRHWNSVVKDPPMKRQVLLDTTNIEPAWQSYYGGVFAVSASLNANSALKAYGETLVQWMSRFISERTRTLVLSDDLCNKAYIFWPELTAVLNTTCPNLRSITFQNGQIHVSVLQALPATVKRIRLDNVRVMKRHEEENYTECLFDFRRSQKILRILSSPNRKGIPTNVNEAPQVQLEDYIALSL